MADEGGIRVLVVDDSAVVRRTMTEILQDDPGIRSIETAADPIFARQKMQVFRPDVMILDIEMPRMDGLTFLKQIMSESPLPVLICSTLTQAGAPATLEAMRYGALGVIAKPGLGLKGYLEDEADRLRRSVRQAAGVRLKSRSGTGSLKAEATAARAFEASAAKKTPAVSGRSGYDLIAMGTSAGGTTALEVVLSALPVQCPGIVVVQHMPAKFTAAFADRLNAHSPLDVSEAKDGDEVRPGTALIAPGDRHMVLRSSSAGKSYSVQIKDGPPINHHRPSVDVLFRSVAVTAGPRALGVIMTGMGDDGAAGLEEMRDAGAYTIGQDEASCTVYGMPRAAFERGAVMQQVALTSIPAAILRALYAAKG